MNITHLGDLSEEIRDRLLDWFDAELRRRIKGMPIKDCISVLGTTLAMQEIIPNLSKEENKQLNGLFNELKEENKQLNDLFNELKEENKQLNDLFNELKEVEEQ